MVLSDFSALGKRKGVGGVVGLEGCFFGWSGYTWILELDTYRETSRGRSFGRRRRGFSPRRAPSGTEGGKSIRLILHVRRNSFHTNFLSRDSLRARHDLTSTAAQCGVAGCNSWTLCCIPRTLNTMASLNTCPNTHREISSGELFPRAGTPRRQAVPKLPRSALSPRGSAARRSNHSPAIAPTPIAPAASTPPELQSRCNFTTN